MEKRAVGLNYSIRRIGTQLWIHTDYFLGGKCLFGVFFITKQEKSDVGRRALEGDVLK